MSGRAEVRPLQLTALFFPAWTSASITAAFSPLIDLIAAEPDQTAEISVGPPAGIPLRPLCGTLSDDPVALR